MLRRTLCILALSAVSTLFQLCAASSKPPQVGSSGRTDWARISNAALGALSDALATDQNGTEGLKSDEDINDTDDADSNDTQDVSDSCTDVSSEENSAADANTAPAPPQPTPIAHVDPAVAALPASPAPTATTAPQGAVTEGMKEEAIIAVLGEPVQTTYLGGLRKMYEYTNCKVIFLDGSVVEVQ